MLTSHLRTDHDFIPFAASLDVRVKVGWVKGLNRLYFLFETQWSFKVLDMKLNVEGLAGTSQRSKIWDVVVR